METATVDRRDMTYLYNDGSDYVFMDGETFEQLNISPETVGDGARFLLENMTAQVATTRVRRCTSSCRHRRTAGTADRPVCRVISSTGGTKPATLETGAEIAVPLFINTGDKLKVDSATAAALGRVNS